MESMIYRLRPTRSEVCDISNGINDGLDGMILSAETAKGLFPKECTATMARICYDTESNIDYVKRYQTQQGNLKMWLQEKLIN